MDEEIESLNEFDVVATEFTKEVMTPTPDPDEGIPDKFKGKSIHDVVKAYTEAEKLIGKQAQEVSEIRKLADQLIQSQLAAKQPQPVEETKKEEIEDVDFFADPKNTILKAIESHPVFKEIAETTKTLAQDKKTNLLRAKHPDFEAVLSDPGFKEWVTSSPVRQKLLADANYNFDVEAADELFGTFKELKKAKLTEAALQAAKVAETSDKALQDATVVGGGTGEVGKKVYRRADLIALRIRDPDRYEALEHEIMRAYSEGRVK